MLNVEQTRRVRDFQFNFRTGWLVLESPSFTTSRRLCSCQLFTTARAMECDVCHDRKTQAPSVVALSQARV